MQSPQITPRIVAATDFSSASETAFFHALAAAGLALIMLFAAVFHISRGELPAIIPTLILLALAAFVAYGRWKRAPIASRASRT